MTTDIVLSHERITTALNEIGAIVGKALQRNVTIRIYGGGALILASNFRRSTHDIDFLGNRIRPLPQFLRDTRSDNPENEFLVAASEVVRTKYRYRKGWFNYQVQKGISGTFDHHELTHHEKIGDFPRQGPGFEVYVPSFDYIIAMKLHALRINPDDNYKDLKDLLCLMRIKGNAIKNPADLVKIHARFYSPRQRRTDFEERIEQLWRIYTTGEIPVFVRRAGIPATSRYLGYGRA